VRASWHHSGLSPANDANKRLPTKDPILAHLLCAHSNAAASGEALLFRTRVLVLTWRMPPAKQSLTAVTAWGIDAKGCSQCYTAGMDGGEAAVLDTRAGQLVRHWTAHSGSIADVACNGEQLITASDVRLPARGTASMNSSCYVSERRS
jgi:hypothetical protein